MATITFAAELQDGGSLTVPSEAVAELGLHTGDSVRVYLESVNGASTTKESDQAALQAKYEQFRKKRHSMTFERPVRMPSGDATEIVFGEIMDEKYRKMGFKL